MASMQHRVPSPEPALDAAKRHFARALEPPSNLDPLVAPRPGDDRR